MMRDRPYVAILADLVATVEFIESLRVSTEGSRFQAYRERLERLITIEPAKDGPVDPARLHPFSALDYVVTLTESHELGTILPYLRTCSPELLRPKLRVIVKGPVLPSDEDSDSNLSRNFLFELNLAAKLWAAGFLPVLGERPDLQCDVRGAPVLFECKRPFARRKIVRRIGEADGTLREILAARPDDARAIIAISVSKILNRGDRQVLFQSEAQGRKALETAVEQAGYSVQRSWRAAGPRVAGVLFHAITPGLDLTTTRQVIAEQIVLFGFADPDSGMVLDPLRAALHKLAF